MLGFIIWNLLWPPKGIIYMEEQIFQWGYVFAKAYIYDNMPNIIILATLYILFVYILFDRPYRPHHAGGHLMRRIIGFLLRLLTTIFLSWFFLVYGALRGQLRGNRGEGNARISYGLRPRTLVGRAIFSFSRLSLHFRLGRGIYRIFYRILGIIPPVRRNARVRSILARVITLLIVLWGVWNIPYDLTH